MSRLITLLAVLGLLLAGSGSAMAGGMGGETVTIPKAAYEAILQRLDALQKRVDQLERERQQERAKAQPASMAKMQKDIDEIYDTLDEVETKALQDRLNFGAEVRVRVDNYYDKDFTYQDEQHKLHKASDHQDNFWSSRFRLNMAYKISRELQFHGRLSVTKNWADNDPPAFYNEFNAGHGASDTNVKFERAYIDWIVPNMPVPLAITFGRQPSTEGPPVEFRENRLRQSTYPALLYDGETDGIVATVGLERYLGIKDSGLRLAYGKGFQDDDDFANWRDTRSGLDDTNFMAAFFEGQIPMVERSLMVFSYIRGFDLVDNPIGPDKNVGDMDLFGVHLQASDIMETGLDAFVSWGLNYAHPNGDVVDMGGLLSDDGHGHKTGWSIYTGVRYRLPLELLNNPKLGFEYNHGSHYWFSFTQSSIEPFNKLATRGNVFDFYYIQPFNRNLFARIGYTYIDYNYTNSGFHLGKPRNSDEILTDAYFFLDCHF